MLQEFDLDTVHRVGTKHENVDFLSRMEKEVGVIFKDNDFFDTILISVDIQNELEEYKDIILYYKYMNFSEGATKQIRTRVAHKSQFYTLMGQMFYFCGRDDILCHAVEKMLSQNCYKNYMKVFMRDILRDELQWRKSLRHNTIGRQYSMILLISANVMKYAKHSEINSR